MKKTNLEIIQIIAKVLGIIAKVVMILCLVGIIASIVGATVLITIHAVGGEVAQQIEQHSGYTMLSLIGTCICGTIMCISGFLIARFSRNYFIMEQEAGTPFTTEGAKAFRSLGIASIVIPLVASLICAILIAVFHCDDIRFEAGIGVGIVMVLLSFVFAYGAELSEPEKGEPKREIEG